MVSRIHIFVLSLVSKLTFDTDTNIRSFKIADIEVLTLSHGSQLCIVTTDWLFTLFRFVIQYSTFNVTMLVKHYLKCFHCFTFPL